MSYNNHSVSVLRVMYAKQRFGKIKIRTEVEVITDEILQIE